MNKKILLNFLCLFVIFILWVFIINVFQKINNIYIASWKNFNNIINLTLSWIKSYQDKWRYNLWDSLSSNFIKVYNLKNELYALITPKEYKSNKIYTANSNEAKSLLYIEDKEFLFRDLTLSIKWIVRSLYFLNKNWTISWASWIIQQLVKNIILKDTKQSLLRKYKELIVSYYLDYNYSKIDILNEYLNKVSYWKNIFWIQRAWELYFNNTWSLSLSESFYLNSLLKMPTFYLKNEDKLKSRAKYYYKSYLESNGYTKYHIEKELKKIDNYKLFYNALNTRIWANNYLVDKFINNNSWKDIILNYDINIQKEKDLNVKMSEELKKVCNNYNACDVWIMLFWKDNKIKYLYSWDYTLSKVDIINSKLEVWSTLKPFIYLKYFEDFWFKNTVSNSKICIKDYCPNNWNYSFNNSISLYTALNLSYNIPIIHIVKESLWLNNIISLFKKLHLFEEGYSKSDYSILLWTHPIKFFDLIRAYSIFLHNWKLQNFSLENSDKVEEVEIFKNAENINKIKNILKWNWFSNKLSIKTWTTENFKDEYIIAFNDDYVVWIWIWNKNWKKTLQWDYALKKGWGYLKIIQKEFFE